MRNGILIPDVKMVYWYIPKCACTSIKTVIARHLGMQVPRAWKQVHGLPFEFIGHGDVKRYNGWKHFTVVRHPLRRILSLYNNKIFRDGRSTDRVRDGVTAAIFSNYGNQFYAEMAFPEFVRAICRVLDEKANTHFKRMSEQLPAINVQPFKSEEMDTLAAYFRSNRIYQPLPHLNKTNGPEWLENYTPELAEMVYTAYESDFNQFNYKNPLYV